MSASQRRLCRATYLVCGDWYRAEDIVRTALAQVYARWSEVDLADARAEPDIDDATAFPEPPDSTEMEQELDLRRPRREPVSVDEDVVRVPTAEETAATIARARQALAEVRRREALEAHRAAAKGRAEQLARWHEQDVAAEMSVPDPALEAEAEAEPALAIRTPWDDP